LGPPELCARFEADRLRRLDELAGLAWPELVRLRFAQAWRELVEGRRALVASIVSRHAPDSASFIMM
jgi:hypothetical protein